MMRFDKSLRDQWQQVEGAWQMELPDQWMQGRSVFGGLTAASALALAHKTQDDSRILRSCSVELLSPTTPGKVKGTVQVLREGKTTSRVQTSLFQEDTLTALVTMSFCQARKGSINVPTNATWQGPDPESLTELQYIPNVIPEFVKNVSMRWATGAPPFSGSKESCFTGYSRYKVPAGDAEGLMGLLDVWPCPSLSMLEQHSFASTISWHAHLFHIPEDFEQWFGFQYNTVFGTDGFHTVVGHLFSQKGELLGWTEQLVVIFDK